jgi:hypothetical protein
MILRNVRHTSDKMNFNSNTPDIYIFDEVYLRRKKLNKIYSKLKINEYR